MMKIGIISDTHLKGPSHFLEKIAEEYFRDVDLILHAGDLTALEVLDAFKGKEVIAVAGNSDSPDVKKRLPTKEVVTASHFKIGLTHGWGFPMGLERKVTPLFQGVHCIVFGHSHWATNSIRNGILYFNPGAFLGGISSLWRRSIGLLNVDREIQGEIIRL
ncbi:MAG: metallophosphoesterase family protein [Deltaproteobacteria bacterium]|nr:MAG: metallophosphoesterase family protein [Deltaproteobacteria bacterium]